MSPGAHARAVRLAVFGGLGLLLGLLFGLVLLRVVGDRALRLAHTQLEVLGAVPAYTLTDQLGRTVSSRDFTGKVVVANFIYTHCRDICPQLSAHMRDLQEHLRKEDLLGRVQLLSFTVDPAQDTPAVLRTYAERHQADPDAWRFLTGPEGTLIPLIVEGFHLGVNVLPPPTSSTVHDDSSHQDSSYEVMHSGRFILIDPNGQIRAYYDGREFDAERVIEDIYQVSE